MKKAIIIILTLAALGHIMNSASNAVSSVDTNLSSNTTIANTY